MSREADERFEKCQEAEEPTATVFRFVPRAERERQPTPPSGAGGVVAEHVHTPTRDGDDDPGPTAA
jgi:hypothetical protein